MELDLDTPKIHLHTTPSFKLILFTGYYPKTKNLANLTCKKGHNSGKNCRKIVIIKLDLDTPKIYLHTKT